MSEALCCTTDAVLAMALCLFVCVCLSQIRAMCVCPEVMPSVNEEVSRLGGSSFLTEFGICAPDGDERSIDTVECQFVMREADSYLQSWTYWDSAFFNDSLHGDL